MQNWTVRVLIGSAPSTRTAIPTHFVVSSLPNPASLRQRLLGCTLAPVSPRRWLTKYSRVSLWSDCRIAQSLASWWRRAFIRQSIATNCLAHTSGSDVANESQCSMLSRRALSPPVSLPLIWSCTSFLRKQTSFQLITPSVSPSSQMNQVNQSFRWDFIIRNIMFVLKQRIITIIIN